MYFWMCSGSQIPVMTSHVDCGTTLLAGQGVATGQRWNTKAK
jgi:hypothetical protein